MNRRNFALSTTAFAFAFPAAHADHGTPRTHSGFADSEPLDSPAKEMESLKEACLKQSETAVSAEIGDVFEHGSLEAARLSQIKMALRRLTKVLR